MVPKAKNPLNELRHRIQQIRRRQTFLGAKPKETLNESHIREMVARKVILPQLKKAFGAELKGVLLVGSTQVGVRKATRKEKTSDLDLVCIFDEMLPRSSTYGERTQSFTRAIKLASQFGVLLSIKDYSINPHHEFSGFLGTENYAQNAFQVLYGREFLERKLGKPRLDKNKLLRLIDSQKQKYANRP